MGINNIFEKETEVSNQLVCISGAFDPLHLGHIRLIQGCKYFGNIVIILNSDEWAKKTHGFMLTPWHDRREILLHIKDVSGVVPVDDDDGTVCEALRRVKPNIFANGGKRIKRNTPERQICEELNIKMIWGIGGGEREQYTDHIYDVMEQAIKNKMENK